MRLPYHEQIYTSAAELLEPGAGHLGVVASTRSFPRELEVAMRSLRSYSILPNLPIDQPASHPCRLIVGPAGGEAQWYCLTQVAFAGADHTGRTTPLAHHAAFELDAMSNSAVTPAFAIRAMAERFQRSWRKSPEWIDPPNDLHFDANPPPVAADLASYFPKLDMQSLLIGTADALVAYSEAQRAVVLAIHQSQAGVAMEIIASALALIPRRLQRSMICCSHVVERGDLPRDCALAITYSATPFWQQVSRREDAQRPICCDLETPSAELFERDGDYAQALREEFADARRGDHSLSLAAEIWDELNLQLSDAPMLPTLVRIRRQLEVVKSVSDVAALSDELSALRLLHAPQAVAEKITQWCGAALTHWADATHVEAWGMLCRVCCDADWPVATKTQAMELLVANADPALRALLGRDANELLPKKYLDRVIANLLIKRPKFVRAIIDRAIKKPSVKATNWAEQALELAAVDPARTLSLGCELCAADDSTQAKLFPIILRRLRAAMLDDANMAAIVSICAEKRQAATSLLAQVIDPLLLERLATASSDVQWASNAAQFIRAAALQQQIPRAVDELAKQYRQRIQAAQLQQWRDIAGEMQMSDALEEAIHQHGLERKTPSPPPVNSEPTPLNPRAAVPQVVAYTRSRVGSNVQGGWRTVGPVWLVGIFALLTLLLALITLSLRALPPVPFTLNRIIDVLTLGGVVIAWFVIELLIRWRVQDVRSMKTLPLVRWLLLAFMVVAAGISMWLLVDAVRQPEVLKKLGEIRSWVTSAGDADAK